MKKYQVISLMVVTILIGSLFLYKKNANPINFAECKFGMSCEFCKNGNYTEWDSKISDGAITYYDSHRDVLVVVGGMKSEGNNIVKKFKEECKDVKM